MATKVTMWRTNDDKLHDSEEAAKTWEYILFLDEKWETTFSSFNDKPDLDQVLEFFKEFGYQCTKN